MNKTIIYKYFLIVSINILLNLYDIDSSITFIIANYLFPSDNIYRLLSPLLYLGFINNKNNNIKLITMAYIFGLTQNLLSMKNNSIVETELTKNVNGEIKIKLYNSKITIDEDFFSVNKKPNDTLLLATPSLSFDNPPNVIMEELSLNNTDHNNNEKKEDMNCVETENNISEVIKEDIVNNSKQINKKTIKSMLKPAIAPAMTSLITHMLSPVTSPMIAPVVAPVVSQFVTPFVNNNIEATTTVPIASSLTTSLLTSVKKTTVSTSRINMNEQIQYKQETSEKLNSPQMTKQNILININDDHFGNTEQKGKILSESIIQTDYFMKK